MIHMHHIRKFTKKSPDVAMDYFTWYSQRRPELNKASIFDCVDLRAEQRMFSKTLGVFDQMFIKLSDIRDGDVPAYLNFQENITQDFIEETDRCYLYSIADNTVAALVGCLKTNGILHNDKLRNWLKNLPRLRAHIRRIIQFFVFPSQIYARDPCDIEIAMQKVEKYKILSLSDFYCLYNRG